MFRFILFRVYYILFRSASFLTTQLCLFHCQILSTLLCFVQPHFVSTLLGSASFCVHAAASVYFLPPCCASPLRRSLINQTNLFYIIKHPATSLSPSQFLRIQFTTFIQSSLFYIVPVIISSYFSQPFTISQDLAYYFYSIFSILYCVGYHFHYCLVVRCETTPLSVFRIRYYRESCVINYTFALFRHYCLFICVKRLFHIFPSIYRSWIDLV